MVTEHEDTIHYPFILFKIQNRIYCVNSKYISSILELPKYQGVPDAPAYITGMFPHRGGSVTMFDLRSALKLPTMQEEFSSFTEMLDARKQDHLTWVSTLEECIADGKAFPLATDPHKCALGRWYDQFQTDSQELSHRLAQMVEPHQRLHHAAIRAEAASAQAEGQDQAETSLKNIMDEVRGDCVPKILDVLDDVKDIFRTRIYHEMVLLLSGNRNLGLVVDEVLAVESLSEEHTDGGLKDWCFSPYLSRIMHSDTYSELILEINVPEILQAGETLVPACASGI